MSKGNQLINKGNSQRFKTIASKVKEGLFVLGSEVTRKFAGFTNEGRVVTIKIDKYYVDSVIKYEPIRGGFIIEEILEFVKRYAVIDSFGSIERSIEKFIGENRRNNLTPEAEFRLQSDNDNRRERIYEEIRKLKMMEDDLKVIKEEVNGHSYKINILDKWLSAGLIGNESIMLKKRLESFVFWNTYSDDYEKAIKYSSEEYLTEKMDSSNILYFKGLKDYVEREIEIDDANFKSAETIGSMDIMYLMGYKITEVDQEKNSVEWNAIPDEDISHSSLHSPTLGIRFSYVYAFKDNSVYVAENKFVGPYAKFDFHDQNHDVNNFIFNKVLRHYFELDKINVSYIEPLMKVMIRNVSSLKDRIKRIEEEICEIKSLIGYQLEEYEYNEFKLNEGYGLNIDFERNRKIIKAREKRPHLFIKGKKVLFREYDKLW